MALANPLPSEPSIHVEELAVNVVSSLDIESTDSVKLTNAISAAKHLISSFSAQFPTLVTLFPVAEANLAGLEVAHQAKRQCLAVQSSGAAGSSSSIVQAHVTPVAPAGSSSSIVQAQVTPVSVVVAPKGGSLDQKQVDALIEHGVATTVISDLATHPRVVSGPLCDQLMRSGPEVQKGLINKMRKEMVHFAWKVSAGTCAAVVHARLAELTKEAVELDRKENNAKKQKEEEDGTHRKEGRVRSVSPRTYDMLILGCRSFSAPSLLRNGPLLCSTPFVSNVRVYDSCLIGQLA